MPTITKLYSKLKASKSEIYKDFECGLNVLNFIDYLEKKAFIEEEKVFKKEILDNLYILFFYNDNNGYSLYGNKSFSYHFNLLFFDKTNSNWYIVDYDIEKILKGIELDKPLLCSEFLQHAFSTDPAKDQIKIAIEEGNYFFFLYNLKNKKKIFYGNFIRISILVSIIFMNFTCF